MQRDRFRDLVNQIHTSENETLDVKAAQYVKSDDQFYNFKRAAIIAGSGANKIDLSSPLGALYGMMLKHIVCFLDILENPEGVPLPLVTEVSKDLRLYTTLAEGILTELSQPAETPYYDRLKQSYEKGELTTAEYDQLTKTAKEGEQRIRDIAEHKKLRKWAKDIDNIIETEGLK